MANDNPHSEVANGQAEAAQSGTVAASQRNASEPQKASSTTSAPPLRKQPSNHLVQLSPSAGTSPRTSRNTSPVRRDSRPQPLSTTISTQPSAAAIQRALSAANVPQSQAGGVTDGVSKLPKPPKSAGSGSGDTTPRWPTSPRLKSPPPPTGSGSNSRRGSAVTQQKKAEGGAAPSISVESATPQTPTGPSVAKQGSEETSKVQQLQTPAKGPSRGPSGKSTLETVQENSFDDAKEPRSTAHQATTDLRPLTKVSEAERPSSKREGVASEGEKHTQHGESGSESASTKSEKKKEQTTIAQRPKNANSKSYTSLAPTKSRQPEGSKPNMTVETETVASIPQSALSGGDRSGGVPNDKSFGSVRLKSSTETIRPKKERKKPAQKARSINQGTASSKADIFEARVANAVDEANSSDSDETFVYESNPPAESQRRARHNHSRTPSVTSSHSVAEGGQRSGGGLRSLGDVLDDRRVAGKRSMKFSNNNAYNNDIDSPDHAHAKDGSVRSSHTPRHFGRFGRGGSHTSMFDQDSPFTQASKLRSSQLNKRGSRPNSPRSPYGMQQQQRSSGLFGKKHEPSFDFDAEGGDDERTPLMGTVRTPRSGRLPRRLYSSGGGGELIDEYYHVRRQSRCGGRFSGCLLGLVVFAAVILSAVAFLVMSNRPMYDVQIREIQNVLASEEELMLDLLVGAVNPNALGIEVGEVNLDVFAKSRFVGSGAYWWQRGQHAGVGSGESKSARRKRRSAIQNAPPDIETSELFHTTDGVDEGTDPPSDGDLEGDAQTMLLGRIFHFDQGLSFRGSPLKRHTHLSVGELRLEKPGNETERGGSERWERVLEHPFEIIVRGVLKYQLPISSRVESAAVRAMVLVHPEDNDEEAGSMRMVDRERWGKKS